MLGTAHIQEIYSCRCKKPGYCKENKILKKVDYIPF